MDSMIRDIVRLADLYAGAGRYAETTASRLAVGSWDAIGRLRAGKDVTTRRANQIRQWFSDNWPAGLAWPADIARPEPARASTPEEAA